VQISGYEKSDQENPSSKGKRNNDSKNTKKLKEKVESKSTEYRDSKISSQAQFSQGNKPEKEKATTEEEDQNQDKEEQGGTTSAPIGKKSRVHASPKPRDPKGSDF